MFIAADLEGDGAPPDSQVPVWHVLFDQNTGVYRSEFTSVNFVARDRSLVEAYSGRERLTELAGFQVVQDCIRAALNGEPLPGNDYGPGRPVASGPPVPINLEPQWVVGQSWDYAATKTRFRRTGNIVTSDVSSVSTVNVEVLDADEQGFVIGFTITGIDVPPTGNLEADAFAKELAELNVGLTYEVSLYYDATVSGIRNLDEVIASLEMTVEKVKAFALADVSPSQRSESEQLLDQLLSNFSTEEGILTFGLPELNLFLLPFGWDLETNTEYEFDNVLPNPLGGPNIPSLALVELTVPESPDDLYQFYWEGGFSGRESEELFLEALQALLDQSGGGVATVADIHGIERVDRGRFTIDASTWTLTEFEFSEQVSIQNRFGVDVTKFELLP